MEDPRLELPRIGPARQLWSIRSGYAVSGSFFSSPPFLLCSTSRKESNGAGDQCFAKGYHDRDRLS